MKLAASIPSPCPSAEGLPARHRRLSGGWVGRATQRPHAVALAQSRCSPGAERGTSRPGGPSAEHL
eukprot:10556116-Alexandrium_andersonii.AAC.1